MVKFLSKEECHRNHKNVLLFYIWHSLHCMSKYKTIQLLKIMANRMKLLNINFWKKNPGLWIMHIPLHSIIPVFHFCFIMWNVLYALKVHLFIIDLISFTQLFFTRHFITIYKPKYLKFCCRNLSYMYQMVISSELPLNSLKF